VLFAVYVFNFVDRQVVGILVGPIQQDLGLSDTVMGLLMGLAFALFYTLAGIPIARLADRHSRRDVIAVSLTLWSGLTAATGLAANAWQFALARLGVGVGEAGGSPPSHSLLSDYFPPERRATALALYANGIYVGAGLAYLLGGWVVTHFDWRTAFFAVGLAGLPLVLLLRLTVREPPRGVWEASASAAPSASTIPPASAADEPTSLVDVARFLLARRTFVWLVAAACCQSIAGYGILNWGAEFLVRIHGMGRGEIGLVFGLLIMLGGCAGVTGGGWLADRMGARDPRWYMLLPAAMALAGLPFAGVFVLSDDVTWALAAFAPFYAISNMYVGPLWSLPQNLVRPEMRATTSAILLFILNLAGMGLGPLLVGALNDLLGLRYGAAAIRGSFVAVVAIGGLAAIFYARGARHLRAELGTGAPAPGG